MSSNGSGNGNANDNGALAVGREIAYRLFAAEYDDATLSHTESDEERAPNYVITPTGARVNRLFVTGTLTEVSPVNDEMVRARVVDPTGAFVVYAGQYQPEALAFLERVDPPLFVAVTGKARTFQPEDSDQVFTSVRPESLATVDADTRERWVVTTAEQTLERIATYAAAARIDARGEELSDILLENGVEAGLARGIPLAQDHYGTTPGYLAELRTLALDAVRVVAGECEQVGSFALAPDDTGAATASFEALAETSDLASVDVGTVGVAASPSSETDAAVEPTTATTSTGGSLEDDGELASESEDEADRETESTLEEGADESAVSSASETTETASFDEETDVAESESGSESESGTGSKRADTGAENTGESGGEEDEVGAGMYEMDDEERAELEEEFGSEFTTGAEVDDPGEADIEMPAPESSDSTREADVETESETESEPVESSAFESESTESASGDDDTGETLGDFQPESSGLTDSDLESDDTDGETGDASGSDESDGSEAEPEFGTEPEDESESEPGDEGEDEAESDAPAADLEDVDLQEYVVDTMRDLDDGDGADRSDVLETVVDELGAEESAVEEAIGDALMGGQCYEPNDDTLKPI